MNLKEQFVKRLLALVCDFEKETGVEIKNIHFKRVDTTDIGNTILDKSEIVRIELEMQ